MKTWALSFAAAVALAASAAHAQPFAPVTSHEAAVVESACVVLDQIMAVPASAIPQALLADAQGIAIVPGMLKGGFVIGVRHGRGVVVTRDELGNWTAPMFITITGGSIGWQIGVQATDLVLVFKTRNSVQGLTRGKFTIGGDIAAAAGPVGRQAQAATDTRLKAEIYSYSRSRGLFAGVSLDGAAMQVDGTATAAYYAQVGEVVPVGQPQPLPPSAHHLLEQVSKYTTPQVVVLPDTASVPAPEMVMTPAPALGFSPPAPLATTDAQQQLAASSHRLASVLDASWKGYLALPAEVFLAPQQPPVDAMRRALERFKHVATNPEYQALAQRPEFQETHALLQQWVNSTIAAPTIQLPPPPDVNR